jgi:hypothetical protein
MAARFGADPNLEFLGEFMTFDAGTELVQSQNMVPIPHHYTRHFIEGPLMPFQAWEIVQRSQKHNNVVACAPLLTFLTQNAAGDTASPLAHQALTVPLMDTTLVQYIAQSSSHTSSLVSTAPSLISSVFQKGSDIHMVYDGTSSGLNDVLWVPSFPLPTANSLLQAVHQTLGWPILTLTKCS